MASRSLLGELLPTAPLVLGVVGYHLASYYADYCVRQRLPALYHHLSQTRHRAAHFSSILAVSWVLVAISVPACTVAAMRGNGTAAAIMGDRPWQATTVEKVCMTSRIAGWLGELPGAQLRPDLMAHHVWSVASGVVILRLGLPPQQLYVMYVALLTEAFLKVSLLLSLFKGRDVDAPLQRLAETRRLRTTADWGVLLGFVGLRLPSVLYSLYVVRQIPYRNGSVWLNQAGMLYYLVYTLYLTYARAKNMGLIHLSRDPPGHYVLMDRFAVSRRSCLVGLARVAMYVSAVTLHSLARKENAQQPDADRERLVTVAAVAAILLGRCRIMSDFRPLKARESNLDGSPKAKANANAQAQAQAQALHAAGGSSGHSSDTLLDSSASEDEKDMDVLGQQSESSAGPTTYTPWGLRLQYALELGVSIWLTSSLGLPVTLDSQLVASVVLTVPLAEVMAPLGPRKQPKAVARRSHVGLLALLHGALVALTVYGITDLLRAAQFSAILHLAIQVCPDSRALAAAPGSRLLKNAALWTVRPMVYSSVAGLLIFGFACHLIGQDVPSLEDRKARGRTPLEEMLDSILHPRTAVCLVGVLLVPIMADLRSTVTEDQSSQKRPERRAEFVKSL